MALTITVAALASAIRVGDSEAETAEITRLRDYANVAIARHLGDTFDDTPDAVIDEAAVRLVGYLYDRPYAVRGAGFANAMRWSGAARTLLPYMTHRLGKAEAEAATAAAGTDAQAAGLGLRQIGSEEVDVATANVWIATALPAPQTAVAGVAVRGPDGIETGLILFRSAVLTGTAVAGGDATAELVQTFALETAADGTVLFASQEAGDHTVYLFEVGN